MDLEVLFSRDTCMKAREENIVKVILRIDEEFRGHYALLQKEMKCQAALIQRMWFLSQRYMLLMSTLPCCKHNEVHQTLPDEFILREYREKLLKVRRSNCLLSMSLQFLRSLLLEFREHCSQLDMQRETPFIVGDKFHKPISYFIELIDDIFKYFHSLLLSFKVQAHLMEPIDPFHLETYKNLLEPSEDFEEYLNQGLKYCKCLQPKPPCEER